VFPILEAAFLGTNVKQFEIAAPRIARKQKPGQFVIIRVHESGERIPLTIKTSNPQRGTITLVVQAVGKTTAMMNELGAGDSLLDVVGPLGKPSEIESYGHCVVIGGGVGTAIALPITQALHDAGNRVTAILGARTKDLLLLELLAADAVDYVLAIGPVPMMRAVAEATRPLGIRTVVSLNSIMVDGTGMCGGCRVIVGDSSKFACVDGPEFDAHEVDFQVLMQRNAMYREQEQLAMARFRGERHA
jgi:ferredoxin--NADP+ reductase